MNESLVKRILDFTETVLVADNHIPLAKQVRSAVDKQQKLRECASNPILEAIPDVCSHFLYMLECIFVWLD